jgi:hypothetical protein
MLFIAIFIILYNSNPTYDTLIMASMGDSNEIKPILNKQNWKGELSNPFFEGLSNSIVSNKTVGVWGPISNSSYTLEELRGINQSRAISEQYPISLPKDLMNTISLWVILKILS